ncbi:winged helix-turn-helix domain-containing protein [Photobacterium angustum]|uniref:winged helix-turn-helix domain-containing protein n=1 Tax=Photobacterium angustum TaxID=661 RepID=UPI0009BB1DC3
MTIELKNVTFCSNRAVLSNGEQQQELNFTEAKLLEILLSKVNETVLKETLKEFAWQHTVVTDSSLTKSIAKLRKALVFFFRG